MDWMDLVCWGAFALNGLVIVVQKVYAWRVRRAERRLRELSLWACMVEDEPEERER